MDNELVVRNENLIIENPNYELIRSSGVDNYLQLIRPAWKAKNLVQRTIKILPIDPSSACQRIFNASIHDLREKVIVAGLDIAQATAEAYHLPRVMSNEDILERYDTSKLINLAHRMGLLTRPEFRKMMRVYDIRKDLEHEDDQYEAGIEDVVYVFKSCIDIILANDPMHIIKIGDINDIIQQPNPAYLDSAVIEDYNSAPTPRQFEIYQLLISIALDDSKADIVRQNSFNALASLQSVTRREVIIDASAHFNDSRLNRRSPLLKEMRVAYVSGIIPYMRKAYLVDFFNNYNKKMWTYSYEWTSNHMHGELLRDLKDVGGTVHIPEEVKDDIVEWLILCYIGEPGGYGPYGRNRRVFYSNSGAPLSFEILSADDNLSLEFIDKVVRKSDRIRREIRDKFVERRLEKIRDVFSGIE